MVGILWHSVAAGDKREIRRLLLRMPFMVQLLAIGTDVLSAVGCSSNGGVEALARFYICMNRKN